jgi:hypothetical protein
MPHTVAQKRAYAQGWYAYARQFGFCLHCFRRVKAAPGRSLCARHLEAAAFTQRLRRGGYKTDAS